jgi:uncharacterized protein DUF2845
VRSALALLLVSFAAPAFADDGMRCGEWLITVGKHEGEVATKCGAPTAAERHEIDRCYRGVHWHVVIDVWTYDRGPRDFVRTLTFEDDVLGAVDVGGYGR